LLNTPDADSAKTADDDDDEAAEESWV
jgi:coiled-coil domain-containing protein 12